MMAKSSDALLNRKNLCKDEVEVEVDKGRFAQDRRFWEAKRDDGVQVVLRKEIACHAELIQSKDFKRLKLRNYRGKFDLV